MNRISAFLNAHYETGVAKICQWQGCTESYQNDLHCFRHVKQKHTNGNELKCRWIGCQYESNSKSNLHHHLKRHFHMIESLCTICEKQSHFKWRFDLSKHMAKFHPDPNTYNIEKIKYEGFTVHVAVPKGKSPDRDHRMSLRKLLN